MSDQVILREYLLALGFKADPVSMGKFNNVLGVMDKRVMAVGKGLLGVAAAAQTMVTAFSLQMEKLYYNSKRANSSAGQLQAYEFAAKKVGLTAEQVTNAVIGLQNSMRLNPGKVALLESLGITTKGRQGTEILTDLMAKLKEMPFFLGANFASQFGIDTDTYFMLSEGLDEFNRAAKERNELNKKAGIDADAAAKAGKEYAQIMSDITSRLGVLYDMMALKLLPTFRDFGIEVVKNLDSLITWLNKFDSVSKAIRSLWKTKEEEKKNPSAKPKNFFEWLVTPKDWTGGAQGAAKTAPGGPTAPSARRQSGSVTDFASIERRYGLPSGLLDRMWAKESGRGKYMKSPAGALGHFGFMPGTAKEWGVDPNNLQSSADGAARYMQFLMNRYGGDLEKALAAYNWGLGNVDKKGMAMLPKETRDYIGMAKGLTVQGPQTNIYVQGDSPHAIAAEVEQAQQRVNADYVRNLGSVLQ